MLAIAPPDITVQITPERRCLRSDPDKEEILKTRENDFRASDNSQVKALTGNSWSLWSKITCAALICLACYGAYLNKSKNLNEIQEFDDSYNKTFFSEINNTTKINNTLEYITSIAKDSSAYKCVMETRNLTLTQCYSLFNHLYRGT